MSVNGVTGTSDVYSTYAAQSTGTTAKTTEKTDAAEKTTDAAKETGVVYEASEPSKQPSTAKIYSNPEVVAKLKAEAEDRTAQLRSLVEKLISKQADSYVIGSDDDMWSLLREGKLNVDEETRLQAEKDISEDGYWGVKQTSDRILDFAQALAGDDPKKLEEMREAFKKGYEQAEKTWGGKLPEISQNTYDAVMEKFDNLIKDLNGAS